MYKKNVLCITAIFCAPLSLTGCASIVNGTNQIVSVQTVAPSGDVFGASCTLQNDKGIYYVTSPGTVNVNRAYGDLNVTCTKKGFSIGTATFKSSTKAMMAGNILFGGVIGAGVDAASGAAYDYPHLLQIMLNGDPAEPNKFSNSLDPIVNNKSGSIAP